MILNRRIAGCVHALILLGAACSNESGASGPAGSSMATGGAAGSPLASAGSGGHPMGGNDTTTGQAGAGSSGAGSVGGSNGGRGGAGAKAGNDTGGDPASGSGGASSDPTPVAKCLSDGNGRLTLITTGGLAVNVQQGNNADCSGGAGPLSILNGTGYTLGIDAPLSGGNGARLNVFIAVPNALQGTTGTYDAIVQIQTYSDAVMLSDAKQWTGNCSVNIKMNQKIATNPAYWTYEAEGSVSCSAPLLSKAIDGGPGTDASLQVMTLDLVTQITWT